MKHLRVLSNLCFAFDLPPTAFAGINLPEHLRILISSQPVHRKRSFPSPRFWSRGFSTGGPKC